MMGKQDLLLTPEEHSLALIDYMREHGITEADKLTNQQRRDIAAKAQLAKAEPIIRKQERERILHKIITAYHNQPKWHKASRMLPDWLGQVLKGE